MAPEEICVSLTAGRPSKLRGIGRQREARLSYWQVIITPGGYAVSIAAVLKRICEFITVQRKPRKEKTRAYTHIHGDSTGGA